MPKKRKKDDLSMTKCIPKKAPAEQEWNPLLALRCLIQSGYSTYEIQQQMNLSRKTIRKVAEKLGLKEKLYRNSFS